PHKMSTGGGRPISRATSCTMCCRTPTSYAPRAAPPARTTATRSVGIPDFSPQSPQRSNPKNLCVLCGEISPRIGAAAKTDFVNFEDRLVREIEVAAGRPRLGPVAAGEALRPILPETARLHPLLDVADHVADSVSRDAPIARAARIALPQAIDL